MEIFYAKRERISLHKSGSVELFINVNFFRTQIDLVVTDDGREERFLSTEFGRALARYRELCSLQKMKKGYADVQVYN